MHVNCNSSAEKRNESEYFRIKSTEDAQNSRRMLRSQLVNLVGCASDARQAEWVTRSIREGLSEVLQQSVCTTITDRAPCRVIQDIKVSK